MAASGHARPSRGSFSNDMPCDSDLSRRRKAVRASAARSNHNPGHAPGFLFLSKRYPAVRMAVRSHRWSDCHVSRFPAVRAVRAKGNSHVAATRGDEPCHVERYVPFADPTVSGQRISARVEFGDSVVNDHGAR